MTSSMTLSLTTMWIALTRRSKLRKTPQVMKMSLKTMQNQSHEEKQRDTSKMILNPFHQLKSQAVMTSLSKKGKNEIILKRVLENLEIISERHKSLTSRRNLSMILIKDKARIKILLFEIKKEHIQVSSPLNLKEFPHWWIWKSTNQELVRRLTPQISFKPKTSISRLEVLKLTTETELIRISQRILEDLIILGSL